MRRESDVNGQLEEDEISLPSRPTTGFPVENLFLERGRAEKSGYPTEMGSMVVGWMGHPFTFAATFAAVPMT